MMLLKPTRCLLPPNPAVLEDVSAAAKLLNCIFHSQGLSAALQQIEFPSVFMMTRGKVKEREKLIRGK